MKKKILTLTLCVAMLATVAVSGTLAYFTDNDQNTNVFTVGGLSIDLYEDIQFQDGADLDKKWTTNGVEKTGLVEDLGDDSKENPNVAYPIVMPGDTMTKIATVENTDSLPAYVALVIKQENYLNFNQNIDDYYEKMTPEQIAALGLTGDEKAEWMQEITDDVFPNWGLLYDKTQVVDDAQVRYTMPVAPADYVPSDGVNVLGVGYANYSYNQDQGGYYYNYSGDFFTNGTYINGTNNPELTGEPNFVTLREDNTGLHDRMWIVYLELQPGAAFDMNLTTVCPTYFDNNSVKAFGDMALDVKAFAIQTEGFGTGEAGQKAAFAEVLKDADAFKF